MLPIVPPPCAGLPGCRFSNGECVFASGSPFKPVTLKGTTYEPGQANNVFIFPGVGFGAVMAKARSVSDAMFVAASQASQQLVASHILRVWRGGGLVWGGGRQAERGE